MKHLISALALSIVLVTSCGKDSSQVCNLATVNMSTSVCRAWGITKDGVFYIAEDLPSEFQQEGLKICVQYEIIPAPPASCTCCVEKAKIKSIARFE